MLLHGMTGTLFAYCVSVIITSPVAAFASLAAYQIVVYAVGLSLLDYAPLANMI